MFIFRLCEFFEFDSWILLIFLVDWRKKISSRTLDNGAYLKNLIVVLILECFLFSVQVTVHIDLWWVLKLSWKLIVKRESLCATASRIEE